MKSLRLAAAGLAFVVAVLGGCGPPLPDRLTLTPVRFADLSGWTQDDLADALLAFRRACTTLLAMHQDAKLPLGNGNVGTVGDWQPPCGAAAALAETDAPSLHGFFETWLTPWKAGNNGKSEGLFTGYYQPELRGAREKGGAYTTPLLRRPPDLVSVDLHLFRPGLHDRIAGRVVDGRLLPYESRDKIEQGALDRYRLAFLWVDDPVDAFFLEIQGSGRIKLPDGSMVQVGYDGQNGQPYVSIGRLLVERGIMDRDSTSLQTIRAWIKEHPVEGTALMAENPSYVFFHEIPGDAPLGSRGDVLTPGRSLAVDRDFVPLGVPIWLDADNAGEKLERLLVAQDTGGAIRGPVRGDVFWGFGDEAAARAGPMKARGDYYLLLPKTVTPVPPPSR
jgi:membrane-bound lytic murein transglycosylase A